MRLRPKPHECGELTEHGSVARPVVAEYEVVTDHDVADPQTGDQHVTNEGISRKVPKLRLETQSN